MRRCIYFVGACVVLLFAKSVAVGQNVPKPLNHEFLIEQGIKLHDKALYDSARGYFRQITRNDSLYGTACYEIALGYYVEKVYDSALVYVKKAVNSGQATTTEQARVLMGSILGDSGKPDSALVCYFAALKRMPYNAKLLYDIGATYYRLDSLDLAERYLIQAITVSPTYYRATFMLGRLNEKMNRRIEAMLCYYMANLINPNVDLVRLVELYLSGESDIKPLLKEYVPTAPSFERIEDYINSKIAMAPKYKPVFKSPTAFVRQGDILFKYLEYDPKVDNFYMNYYVRVLTFLRDKKQVETAMYVYFSDFNMEHVQKWLKSNQSKTQKFFGMVGGEIWRLAGRGLVNDANYEGINYVFSKAALLEFGKYSDEKNKTKEGLWQFVEKDGSVSTIMNYKNGKPEGEMQDFNSNGQLVSRIPFVNGIKSGEGRLYHGNGLLKAEALFENDKLHGKLTRYFLTGQKQAEENYKNDVANGLFTNYFKNGAILDSVSRTNGKQNGEYYSYYVNGQLRSKGRYINDLVEGEVVRYYPDEQISSQGNFAKNTETGKWVDYHPNGKVAATYSYNDKGNLSDTTKRFDANGVLLSISIYSNNGKNALTMRYRPDGTMFVKEDVKNDNLVKNELFDKNGKIVETINISSSGTHCKGFNMFENVASEGMHKGGKMEGRWIFYGIYGNIERVSYYKKGEKHGIDTAFFPNGKIKFIEPYKEGKLDGYATQYNQAGNISSEGYVVNDEREGYWLFYDNTGRLTHKSYYSNDELDQWQQEFHFNGNLSREVYYNNYLLKEIINYDTNGVEYERLFIPDSACKIVEHFPNGKVKSEIHYLGCVPNGLITHFHANGQKNYSYNSILSNAFDTIRFYDESGKHTGTRIYINDKLYGKEIYVYDDEDRGEFIHFNGQIYDTGKWYSNENKLLTAIAYMEDERHGWTSYYDESGELAFRLLYHNGIAIECFSPKNNQHIKIENNQKITTYFANGTKSAEMTFKNGYFHGEFIRYYSNGKLYRKCYYETGDYEGIYQEYYSNGNLKKEINYTADEYNGTAKKYHPNGKLKEEAFYVSGKKHGEQKHYNQQGTLVKKTKWYYGVFSD